jgi:hypothetical protein
LWVFGGGDGTFGGGEEGGDVEEVSSQMDFVGFIGARGLWSIEKGEVFHSTSTFKSRNCKFSAQSSSAVGFRPSLTSGWPSQSHHVPASLTSKEFVEKTLRLLYLFHRVSSLSKFPPLPSILLPLPLYI